MKCFADIVNIRLCLGCSATMDLTFFCISVGAFANVVVDQVCSGWAFSETITLFFGSLLFPIHIKLNLGFLFSSTVFCHSLKGPSRLIFDMSEFCSVSLAYLNIFSDENKKKRMKIIFYSNFKNFLYHIRKNISIHSVLLKLTNLMRFLCLDCCHLLNILVDH